MEKKEKNLQTLQDAFSNFLGIQIVISNEQGEEVTRRSGDSRFVDFLLDQKDLVEERKRIIGQFHNISSPIIYDFQPGIKTFVAPIAVNTSQKYYLWTSFVIDEGTRKFIHQVFEQNDPSKDLKSVIDEVPEVTDEEKNQMLERIGSLCQMIAKHFEADTNDSIHSSSLIQETLKDVATKHLSMTTLLRRVKEKGKLGFIGVAERTKTDYFSIQFFCGPDEVSIENKKFSTGEGFLGEVVALGKGKLWKDVSKDPRVAFFMANGLKPVSIVAYPLIHDDHTIGVLFAGSFEREIKQNEFQSFGEWLAQLVTIHLQKQHLEGKLNQYDLQISTFNDILQLMTTMKDVKRVLFVLVDISINLTNTPFSFVILKPNHGKSQATVISRGLHGDEIQQMGSELAQRYFHSDGQSKQLSPTLIKPSHREDQAFIIPIHYQDEVLGCLAIGAEGFEKWDEISHFLSNLAMATGVIISKNTEEADKTDKVIQSLYLSISQHQPVEFASIQEEQQLLKDFLIWKGYSYNELQPVIDAAKLKSIEETILHEVLTRHPTLGFIHEFKRLQSLEANPELDDAKFREESQFLYLVWSYIKSNRDVKKLDSIRAVQNQWKSEFKMYVSKQDALEVTIELSSSSQEGRKNLIDSIPKDISISKREKEVLNLVIQGYSNKEIASELFISDHTVKNHVTNIFHKLNVTDRAQAIAKVYQHSATNRETLVK
ncbi:LuxR C-terminal-related transcriptional regulator [Salinibacillus xinjiangensis]|uniref:HTH luxR-type domain-containing protein n=1 Tax=Salinibacillus xinjiangensis TaxID=1229268 RepID=A0A6G1X470_9BACI|nr:LuxR C-terminal-related transcriptional regulator [Salinibacillus xinjiangensis]MRG85719.1 hypothetical protein [Salinibacillus xinjiangensis]